MKFQNKEVNMNTPVDKHTFIETTGTSKIIRSADRTIKDNAWLVVTGDVGTGKSRLRNYLTDVWKSDPRKFAVLELPAFKSNASIANLLMRHMIKIIDPDEQAPRDTIDRFNRLKTVLMMAHRRHVKPILMIDEAQDLTESSIREIKKIHEISAFGLQHLFPIVMFAKPNSLRLDALLEGREIGYRVRRAYMAPLTQDEMLEFADHFGLKFGDAKARNYFFEFIHPSPLGVEHLADMAKDSGHTTLTRDLIQKMVAQTTKDLLKFHGYNYGDLIEAYRERYNTTISKQTVMRSLEGDKAVKGVVAERIRGITSDLIGQARGAG